MSSNVWTVDLLAGTLQTALLLMVGLALPRLFRLRHPSFCLWYWRGLLAVTVLLPLGMFWQSVPEVSGDPLPTLPWFTEVIYSAPAKALPTLSYRPLVVFLALGVAFRLAWLLLGLAALRHQSRRARPFVPRPLALGRAERLLGVEAQFLTSSRVKAPVTFGVRHPVVLLPQNFEDLSPEAQESVACHELLHVRRRDWIWVLGEELLRALLWFHPGVWVLLDRIALSREQWIDRRVIQLLKHRRPYLEALWIFARGDGPACAPAAAHFLNRGHLIQRVTLLTQEVNMSRRRSTLYATALATALALTAVVAPSLFPWSAEVPPSEDIHVVKPSFFLLSSHSQGGGEEILHVEGDVMKPIRLAGEAPVYPEEARKERIEGPVVVKTVISQEGIIESTEFLQSLGPAFEHTVKNALTTWRFKPATLKGQPVKVYYILTINFRLDSGQPDAPDA